MMESEQVSGTVLPTPVGMVRKLLLCSPPAFCSPHARGDGPDTATPRDAAFSFSPRPWGWSVGMTWGTADQVVLPTPVGMVRNARRRCVMPGSSPHARGDGPASLVLAMRW